MKDLPGFTSLNLEGDPNNISNLSLNTVAQSSSGSLFEIDLSLNLGPGRAPPLKDDCYTLIISPIHSDIDIKYSARYKFCCEVPNETSHVLNGLLVNIENSTDREVPS